MSNVLFAIGLASLAVATGPLSLITSWVILGAAMSCELYEAAFSALARIYGKEARSSITGIALIAGFASTVGWPLTAFLEISFGWRAACFTWAAVHVLICLPLNVLLPRERHSSPAPVEPVDTSTERRNNWMMIALAFVFAGRCSAARRWLLICRGCSRMPAQLFRPPLRLPPWSAPRRSPPDLWSSR